MNCIKGRKTVTNVLDEYFIVNELKAPKIWLKITNNE
nr:MAG TPA: hypothetical protein [Caudoviricetes sp.]